MRTIEIPGRYPIRGEVFESIHEFTRITDSRPNNTHGRSNTSSHSTEGSQGGWYNTPDYATASALLMNGWDEPLADMKRGFTAATRVKSVESRTRAQYRNHMVGCTPNVPRAILGLPDAMRQIYRQPVKEKTLSIHYNISMSGGVPAPTLIKSGVTILAAVATLERLGFRVRLYAADGTGWGEHGLWIGVLLKDYRDPLDLKKLCYPIAHPSMLRRTIFRWEETTPVVKTARGGYGQPFDRAGNGYNETIREYLKKEHGHYISLRDCEGAQFDPDTLLQRIGISTAPNQKAA